MKKLLARGSTSRRLAKHEHWPQISRGHHAVLTHHQHDIQRHPYWHVAALHFNNLPAPHVYLFLSKSLVFTEIIILLESERS
jgi:hypothetical protein